MKSYVYEIPGPPVSWSAHQGYGKRSFNPKFKQREYAQWILREQNANRVILSGALRVDLFFEMPVPKSLPKKITTKIHAGEKVWHTKRPDVDNLRKFINDCLTGTVWCDDSQITCGESQKYYAKDKPRTVIIVQEI